MLERLRTAIRRINGGSFAQVVKAMARGATEDEITGLAAEMAFFGILSVFPLTIAIAAGIGYLEPIVGTDAIDRVRVDIVTALSTGLGSSATGMIEAIEELFATSRPSVFTIGLVVAVWSASRGFRSTVRSVDAVYRVHQRRTFLELRLLSLAMALIAVPLMALGLVAFAIGPLLGGGTEAADVVGAAEGYRQIWYVLRWPASVLVAVVAVTTVLYIAPDDRSTWRANLPGAVLTILSWSLATVALRLYLRFGGSENLLIGGLGAVLVVMIWLYLLALGLLVGAELNTVLAQRWGIARTPRTRLEFDTIRARTRRVVVQVRSGRPDDTHTDDDADAPADASAPADKDADPGR